MGRYRKIDTRTWNDQKFNELSDYGKLVFFLLLSHPHLTSIKSNELTFLECTLAEDRMSQRLNKFLHFNYAS